MRKEFEDAMNKVLFTTRRDELEDALRGVLKTGDYDKVFLLADEVTSMACVPLVRQLACVEGAKELVISAGDDHKDLSSAQHVWEELQRGGATRHSLVVNVGGGMVSDLGGWCASCFKRGVDFVNLPTTLLAMVDASVGGKTGVNLGGVKNEVGVFNEARLTVVDTRFLSTLDKTNMLAGFAEMVKHSLLCNEETLAELLRTDIDHTGVDEWGRMIEKSVEVKRQIVEEDPREKGRRKALNFGHTIGHAIESFSIQQGRPLLHGHAVAHGMVGELYLSVMKVGFPVMRMRQVVSFLRNTYGPPPITCNDYPTLLEAMTHDKKNTQGRVNFTLLRDVGDVMLDQTAQEEEIKEALDFLREGM